MIAHRNFQKSLPTNENGYVLIGALLFLLLLIVIGIAATTSSRLELQIAGNDRVIKETFYQADGGTHLGIRLVEESIAAAGPFTQITDNVLNDSNGTIVIVDTSLADNGAARDELQVSTASRDIAYYPNGYDPLTPNATPHTNIIADGVTSLVAGSGLQMLSGYEGMGKGTAGGGGQILFTIHSQHVGNVQSEAIVRVEWRHIIGLELEGRY